MLSPSTPSLTFNQQRVLQLIAAGNSLEETAAVKGCSPKSIDGTLHLIRRRLEARNTVEAVAIALMNGLLDHQQVMDARRERGHFGHPARRREAIHAAL
jgi:DNA-binding CsgD family transcriptional regulator